MSELLFCECGCGERVTKKGNRFIHNHHLRGKPRSDITKKKIRMANKGRKPSEKEREKMREAAKKKKPFTDKHKRNLSKSGEGRVCSDTSRLKLSKWNQENPQTGTDIVQHHYTYDDSDKSKYTIGITRSDHMKLHRLLEKLNYMIPHINVKEDN